MRMLKLVSFIAVAFLLGSCGKSAPVIATPADGQTFVIEQTSYVDVTMTDNDYQDVTISFRGTEALAQFQFSCANAVGGPARCQRAYTTQPGGFFGGFGGSCTQQAPCVVTIIAARGDQKDVRTISFTTGGGAALPR